MGYGCVMGCGYWFLFLFCSLFLAYTLGIGCNISWATILYVLEYVLGCCFWSFQEVPLVFMYLLLCFELYIISASVYINSISL
ncbi:hypothetical protein B0J14DRAFT_31949 [Halenospora varia]|nr:hypothetical protein B0J14DRAFT_31949 [Halenospora varia]